MNGVGALLAVHVAAGVVGLLLGPVALAVSATRRTPLAVAYHAAVVVVTVTATALVALSPARLWWLLPVAVATQAAAVGAVVVLRRRRPGWTTWYAHLIGGTYIALVTGLLIGTWGDVVAWALPAVAAQPLIQVAKGRLRAAELRPQPPTRPGHRAGRQDARPV